MVDPAARPGRWIGPLLAAGLFAAWFFPAIPTLGDRFLGVEYVDHYGTQWFYWYAGEILAGRQSAAHTDLFFFPWGKDVYGHTGSNLLDAWLAAPLIAIFGPVAGYNYFVAGLVALNVALGARLAGRFTEDGVARWTAGALLGLQPYLLNELTEGRPTQVLLAFFLLFFDRILELRQRGRVRDAIAAGLLLALTGHTYWFYALFAGVAAVVVGWRRPLVFGLAATVAALGTVPFAWSLARSAAAGNVPGLLDLSAWSLDFQVPLTREGQLVGLYAWQPLGGGQGFWIVDIAAEEHFVPRIDPLPLLYLLLGAAILLRPGTLPRRLFAALAAVSVLLSAGPVFVVGELALSNPVYHGLLELLPPLQRLWWPGRAFVLVGLLAPLGAIPVVTAFPAARRAWVAAALLVAEAVTLARSDLLPAPDWDATVPAGYACLAEGPPGAVIELPYAFTQGHLYYQTRHGRPIFGGMLEDNPVFAPPEHVKLRSDNAFLAALLAAGDEPGTAAPSDEARAEIGALGYRYVVLQLDAFRARVEALGLLEAAMRARLRDLRRGYRRVLGDPVYEDARVVIWAPWGGGAPCDLDEIDRDESSPGRTDVVSAARDIDRGRRLTHLGRAEDAATRLAQLVIARGGPMAEAAAERLEAPR